MVELQNFRIKERMRLTGELEFTIEELKEIGVFVFFGLIRVWTRWEWRPFEDYTLPAYFKSISSAEIYLSSKLSAREKIKQHETRYHPAHFRHDATDKLFEVAKKQCNEKE